MNIFVYGAEIVCDKEIQKSLIMHVQMVYNCMTSHKIYRIYCHWREVISPKIPFITIVVMRQYGGHYKVNGPPVSVPATLDQIIDILPCMPSELQLHPVKLKHKLDYKSHYMYDMIHRDHVMSAITWFKQHNTHYRDITLNKQRYSDITSRQLSLQLDESDNHITVNENALLNQSLKNDKINIETPKKDDN